MDSDQLKNLYVHRGMSMKEMATHLGCSVHKVDYWMKKFSIHKRSISDSLMLKKHGLNGGFTIKTNMNTAEQILFGLGLGIYWGEGNKRNRHTVRVGNTDAYLIATFVEFLVRICGVARHEIRYSLQLFTDVDERDAVNYWLNELKIDKSQIMPTINRIKSGKIGTYKMKNQHGVMTVYVFNMRLRNWPVDQLSVPR